MQVKFSQLAMPEHMAVSRSIAYALTTGDFDGWSAFTAVALLRLGDDERVALAYAALKSLHPSHIAPTLTAALGGALDYAIEGAIDAALMGGPSPVFNDVMSDAAKWADMAHPREWDAYCLASFNHMTPQRQNDFLGFVQGRAVA